MIISISSYILYTVSRNFWPLFFSSKNLSTVVLVKTEGFRISLRILTFFLYSPSEATFLSIYVKIRASKSADIERLLGVVPIGGSDPTVWAPPPLRDWIVPYMALPRGSDHAPPPGDHARCLNVTSTHVLSTRSLFFSLNVVIHPHRAV